jgi:hypothetical protein
MRPALVFAGWGVALAFVGAIGLVVFGFKGPEPPALFGGAAATMVVLGLYVGLARLGTRRAPEREAVADLSPATVWLAISVVLLVAGAELGLWLVLIAAGAAVVGVAGLVRELSAQRRAEREAGR